MGQLDDLLKDGKFIIMPREIYDKIIPIDKEDLEQFLKERKKYHGRRKG